MLRSPADREAGGRGFFAIGEWRRFGNRSFSRPRIGRLTLLTDAVGELNGFRVQRESEE